MILKSILVLLLAGGVPLASAQLGATDNAICGVYPDPHFTSTWCLHHTASHDCLTSPPYTRHSL